MSLRVLSKAECDEITDNNFKMAARGDIVDLGTLIRSEAQARYAILKEKNESSQTLTVIALTKANISLLLSGGAPAVVTIGKKDVLNLHHPT